MSHLISFFEFDVEEDVFYSALRDGTELMHKLYLARKLSNNCSKYKITKYSAFQYRFSEYYYGSDGVFNFEHNRRILSMTLLINQKATDSDYEHSV